MREFSSAGLEHLPYKQRVGGSNPSTPTKLRPLFSGLFLCSLTNSVSRWRLGRLICVLLLFATANLCLCPIIAFENRLSVIIRQSQQSSIETAALRSPLNCCDRSNPIRIKLHIATFISITITIINQSIIWLFAMDIRDAEMEHLKRF